MRISLSGVRYVAQYGSDSTVYRVNYIGSNNQPPTAVATASADSGPTPLTVMFSSAGSADPEAKPLSYAWDFQSDVSTAVGLISTENTWQVLNVSYKDEGAGALSLTGVAKLRLHFDRIEAEHYERQGEAHDIMTQDTMDLGGGRNVGWINDGSYLCWNEMNFKNITAIKYRVASAGTGGRIALHQDSINGPLVATKAEVPVTGDWQSWQDVTVNVSDPGGTHKFCFLFERNPGDELLFNLNYIDFIGAGVGQ